MKCGSFIADSYNIVALAKLVKKENDFLILNIRYINEK